MSRTRTEETREPELLEAGLFHNGFAETVVDIDFAKGETDFNRFNGDASNKPNPCIGKLATSSDDRAPLGT